MCQGAGLLDRGICESTSNSAARSGSHELIVVPFRVASGPSRVVGGEAPPRASVGKWADRPSPSMRSPSLDPVLFKRGLFRAAGPPTIRREQHVEHDALERPMRADRGSWPNRNQGYNR
jgi:hypothetical protein